MTNRKLWIGLAVLAIMIASAVYIKLPLPHIQMPPETLFMIGPVPFTNTMLALLFADSILIVMAVMATRRMSMVPRGLQNFFEIIIDFWQTQAYNNIGEKLTQTWLPLVLTVFFMIWFSNYAELLPGFDSIGLLCTPGDCPGEQTAAHSANAEGGAAKPEEEAHHTLFEVTDWNGLGVITARLPEDAPPAAAAEGRVLVPFLRVAASDLNMPLALALIAFLVIEFAGFKALGFGYLRKFFNFKEGAIMIGVGLLELISEIMRIITFSFRLFGNVFAGQTLLFVFPFLVPALLVLPIYGLELFVGLIQSYVFAVLILAFMQQAVTAHHAPDHGGHDAEHH
ncbi:MAG: FoF1 ATP synthase subunit a [Ardenticatenales bacterium]